MKKKISYILIISMLFNLIITTTFMDSNVVYGVGNELEIEWFKGYVLNDDQLRPIKTETKYDRETALVDWDMSKDGKYILSYHLTDDQVTEVIFNKTSDEFDVTYKSKTALNLLDPSDTQVSYIEGKEWSQTDFSVTPPGKISAIVTSDAAITFNDIKLTSENPRKSFKVNNVDVKFSYYNDIMYYSTTGLEEGNLTPFTISYFNSIDINQGTSEIQVLRSLEDFVSTPSHYEDNPPKEPDVIEILNNEPNPGTKPGITLSFKHPKSWDDTTKSFIIDNDENLKKSSVLIKLSDNSEGTGINSITTSMLIQLSKSDGEVKGNIVDDGTIEDINANRYVEYTYISAENKYEIKIVQNNEDLIDNDFVQWSVLTSSKLYDTTLKIIPGTDGIGDIRTNTYYPESMYSYTYLEYNVNRESAEDAYIEIKPYAGLTNRTLYYNIYSSNDSSDLEEDPQHWLTYTHTIGETGDEDNLLIPILFDTDGNYYKIIIEFDNNVENGFIESGIKSQTSHFKPDNEDIIAPPVPKIIDIESEVYQNIAGDIEQPSKIKTKLTWEAPSATVLEDLIGKGDLYYELMISENAFNSEYIPIKIFKVDKENGDIRVREVQDSLTSDEIAIDNGYDVESEGYSEGYNENENKFCVDNIILLKNSNEWSKKLNIISELEDIEVGKYEFESTDNEYEGIQTLPNVNFIKMRGINVSSEEKKGAASKNSFIKSLSLSLSKRQVPIVTNLDYRGVTFEEENDFAQVDVTWKSADWANFDKQLEVEHVYYDMYISESKEDLLNTIPSGIIKVQGTAVDTEINLNNYITDIRDGKVIEFSKEGDKSLGSQKVIVKGLDQNQVYYTYIVTRFEDGYGNSFSSENSEVLSMTTNNKSNKPIEKDKSPLVPENFEVLEMISDSSIKLEWDKNGEPMEQNETIGYEVIRVENDVLTDDQHNNKKLEDIINERNGDALGFRVIYDEDTSSYKLYKYEDDKDVVEIVDHFEENIREKILILNDDELAPNLIYYYYLRAIRAEDSQIKYDVKPSLWTALTYTTKPIARPINLKVDYTQTYRHDSQHELIVYFEVPDYFVDINYKPIIFMNSQDDTGFSDDDDYENYKKVGVKEGNQTGYKILYYKISGDIESPDLKSGKSFSIKVCIEDRSGGTLTSGKYPRSSFSDRVIARTEYDEAEYDRENKINNYMKYYEKQAEELYKNLYWTIKEKNDSLSVIYRNENFQSELKSIPGSDFKLVTNDKKDLTYYIPKDVLDTIENNNINLIVSNGVTGITISSDTLNKSKTTELREFIEDVKYEKEVVDYYVVLRVEFEERNKKINGTESLSDIVSIELDAQGSEMVDFELEARAIQELDQLIERKKPHLEVKIIEELNEDRIDEDEIIELIDEKIDSIEGNHASYIKSLISRYTHHVIESSIDELYEPIAIKSIVKGAIGVQGYKKDGSDWEEQSTQIYDNISVMYVDTTGEFVFAGKESEANPINSIGNGYQITKIFEKYRLGDFYSTEELENLDRGSSKSDLISAVARILGAEKGIDSVRFLKNNGIDINESNKYDDIKKDEATYILVKVYEIKQDIDLKSVIISNYNEIKDMDSVSVKYKEEVLVGRALELIELNEGYFNPNNPMSLKQVLTTIGLIENKPW